MAGQQCDDTTGDLCDPELDDRCLRLLSFGDHGLYLAQILLNQAFIRFVYKISNVCTMYQPRDVVASNQN